MVLSLPDKFVPGEQETNPALSVHGLMNDHKAARHLAQEWAESEISCNMKKAAVMSAMTYNCQLAPDSQDKSFKTLDAPRQNHVWSSLHSQPCQLLTKG